MCDLPGRLGKKGSNWFNLQLKVDGEEVQNSKNIEYRSDYTPEIREVLPRYGRPGDLMTIKGKIYTKEYGNSNFGDEGSVENRREESITALMLGTTPCELTDELGNVYKMELDSEDSDYGTLACKPAGSFIGAMNATLYVSGKYGKSRIKNAYSVNSKGQLFVYHTLPEITSISPNTGGSKGGTQVTIKGNSFDAYGDITQVRIGSTPCDIVTIDNNELVCSTPPEDSLSGTGIGPRGLLYELWKETEGDVTNTSSLDTGAEDYHSKLFDGSDITGPMFNETKGYTQRLSGLFVAPYTGDMSFFLQASDESALYLSNNTDPANKVRIIHHSGKKEEATVGRPNSGKIEMEKGKMYFIEAVHVQKNDSSVDNFMKISLWQHKTSYHNSQTSLAQDERQNIRIRYKRQFETQRVSFNNMANANGSEVLFTHNGMKAKESVDFTAGKGWNETMTNMMMYTCESSAKQLTLKQDYENTDYRLPGSHGTMRDGIQAYCGARAMENQERVTHSYRSRDKEIDAKKYPWFCFAAKGLSYIGRISILFLWEDTRKRNRRDWVGVNDFWTPTEDWSHQCINMAREGVSAPARPLCLAHAMQRVSNIVGLTAIRLAFLMGYG